MQKLKELFEKFICKHFIYFAKIYKKYLEKNLFKEDTNLDTIYFTIRDLIILIEERKRSDLI